MSVVFGDSGHSLDRSVDRSSTQRLLSAYRRVRFKNATTGDTRFFQSLLIFLTSTTQERPALLTSSTRPSRVMPTSYRVGRFIPHRLCTTGVVVHSRTFDVVYPSYPCSSGMKERRRERRKTEDNNKRDKRDCDRVGSQETCVIDPSSGITLNRGPKIHHAKTIERSHG